MPPVCLGKRPTRVDPRTLRFSKYVKKRALPPPPASLDYGTKVKAWGMMANDTVGCCTTAAAGHQIQTWTSQASRLVTVSDKSVLAAYSAVTAYDPKDPDTDQGAYEIDALNFWRKKGVGGRRILAYAGLDFQQPLQVRQAAYVFGGAYIGLALPLTAQAQTGGLWDVTGPAQGEAAPGSWGGHAVNVVAYDRDGLAVVTWGQIQWMTWGFWARYCDEAYCIISLDWLGKGGKSPPGFNLVGLVSDIYEITGKKVKVA
jgi:hypothetical protein